QATVAPMALLQAAGSEGVEITQSGSSAVRVRIRKEQFTRGGVAIPVFIHSNARSLLLSAQQNEAAVVAPTLRLDANGTCGNVLSRDLPLGSQTYFAAAYRRGCD